MSRHRFEIKSTSPFTHQVFLDGLDIADSLSGLTVHMRHDEVPRVELDVQLIDVTELGSVEVEVALGKHVHSTLVALGWTPPPEAGAQGG